MKPIELKDKLKEGMKVKVIIFGDATQSYTGRKEFEGIIGELENCIMGFYVWNNSFGEAIGTKEYQRAGYSYNFYTTWDKEDVDITILDFFTEKPILNETQHKKEVQKMKVSEAKGILKVGDHVRTNGDCGSVSGEIIEGIVASKSIYSFEIARIEIMYSWSVYFDNEKAWIEILNTEAKADTVENKMTKCIYEVLVIDKEANKILLNETVIGTTQESVTTSISINNAEMLKKIKAENLCFSVRQLGSYEEVRK